MISSEYVWIGGSLLLWRWLSSGKIAVPDWHARQPNLTVGEAHVCVEATWKNNNFKWDAISCDAPVNVICSYDIPPTTPANPMTTRTEMVTLADRPNVARTIPLSGRAFNVRTTSTTALPLAPVVMPANTGTDPAGHVVKSEGKPTEKSAVDNKGKTTTGSPPPVALKAKADDTNWDAVYLGIYIAIVVFLAILISCVVWAVCFGCICCKERKVVEKDSKPIHHFYYHHLPYPSPRPSNGRKAKLGFRPPTKTAHPTKLQQDMDSSSVHTLESMDSMYYVEQLMDMYRKPEHQTAMPRRWAQRPLKPVVRPGQPFRSASTPEKLSAERPSSSTGDFGQKTSERPVEQTYIPPALQTHNEPKPAFPSLPVVRTASMSNHSDTTSETSAATAIENPEFKTSIPVPYTYSLDRRDPRMKHMHRSTIGYYSVSTDKRAVDRRNLYMRSDE